MTKFRIASCHEIGISWTIEAPKGVSEKEVESLMEYICNWTDAPDDGTYLDCLISAEDDLIDHINDNEYLNIDKLKIYQDLKAYPDVVHRDFWTQDLTESVNA